MVMNVYIILWVEQFGMFSFKNSFLSLINFSKVIGVSLGLLLNYTFTPEGFKKSLLIETILLSAIGCALIPIHSVYFVQ